MRPLVLTHGFLGGAAQWAALGEALAGAVETFAVDLPGFGANAAHPAPSTIEGFAAFMLDAASAAGIERFDLLGHSMGGMIAQEMTRLAPERIERLALYGTGASGAMPGRFETIAESKRRAAAEGAGPTARRIAATWFRDGARAPGFAATAALAEQASVQAIGAGLDAMAAWSGVAHLPRIAQPTLILWGDRDRSYAWAQTEQLWRAIPDASLAVAPGCAHVVHAERPALFTEILRGFLRPQTVGASG